jgi:hypothetical protein
MRYAFRQGWALAVLLCWPHVWSQAADSEQVCSPEIQRTSATLPSASAPGRRITSTLPPANAGMAGLLPTRSGAKILPVNDQESNAGDEQPTPPVPPPPLEPITDPAPSAAGAPEPVVKPVEQHCDRGGAPCCDSCSLIAGGQATFFWPNFNHAASTSTIVDAVTPATSFFSSNASSVDNNMIVAPRVWLGVQGPRWGLVGRYWNASVWSDNLSPNSPLDAPLGSLSSNRFSAYMADLEVQRLFCTGCWDHRAFFGVRYGGVNLDSDLNVKQLGFLNTATSSASTSDQFFGTGITFGLFSTRPIACSCWSLYVGPRISILWGQSSGVAQASAFASDAFGGSAGAIHGVLNKGNSDLFLAELQWGAQWERQLVCSPARAFIRIGGEWQYWDTNNNRPAQAGSFAAVQTISASSLASATGGVLFNMIGFTIGAGIIY